MRGLDSTLEPPASALRELELKRLDQMQSALWLEAMKGHVPTVLAVLRLMVSAVTQ
jgi:hypothetical protein